IIGDRMDKDIHHSFEEMNNALKKKIAHVIGKAGSDGDGKACRGTNSAAQRLRYGDPRSDDSIPKQLLVRPTEHHMGRPGIMKV
ncbi:MAG: hypothetical protein WA323_05770, partial [Candidatus Nitrosopolaris sp.]